MALIAVAADKGAPGVTTASVALAAVWPRPVLLAECDPAGGDLVYRLPAADGGRLDPRRGLLSLAVAARRGLQPHQVWEHAQKLHGGLDILAGVSNAEQGAGLELLWGAVGRTLAAVPQADVIADCGRIGVDGPAYDLLAQASTVVLLSRATLGDVIRLRDRVTAVAVALQKRGRSTGHIDVVVVADYKYFSAGLAEVGQALRQNGLPGRVVGGLAYEPKSADQLRGEWSGKLDKSMLIRTARAIAGDLVSGLPAPTPAGPAAPARAPAPAGPPAPAAAGLATGPQRYPGPTPAQQPYAKPPGAPYPASPSRAAPPRGPQPSAPPYAVPAVPPSPPPGSRGRHAGAPVTPSPPVTPATPSAPAAPGPQGQQGAPSGDRADLQPGPESSPGRPRGR